MKQELNIDQILQAQVVIDISSSPIECEITPSGNEVLQVEKAKRKNDLMKN